MSLVSPYKHIEQTTVIKLLSNQLNSDIRNNMKLNLKKKVEKKCNKNGFIEEVFKILEYSNGLMRPENLAGYVIFDVKYECKMCLPIENTTIIANIKTLNQELIIAVNGPIFIFIPKEYIDSNIWNLEDLQEKKTGKKLEVNSYVKILIINKRINQNDHQIKTIGILKEIATDKEIKDYYGNIIEDINSDVENEDSDNDNYII